MCDLGIGFKSSFWLAKGKLVTNLALLSLRAQIGALPVCYYKCRFDSADRMEICIAREGFNLRRFRVVQMTKEQIETTSWIWLLFPLAKCRAFSLSGSAQRERERKLHFNKRTLLFLPLASSR